MPSAYYENTTLTPIGYQYYYNLRLSHMVLNEFLNTH